MWIFKLSLYNLVTEISFPSKTLSLVFCVQREKRATAYHLVFKVDVGKAVNSTRHLYFRGSGFVCVFLPGNFSSYRSPHFFFSLLNNIWISCDNLCPHEWHVSSFLKIYEMGQLLHVNLVTKWLDYIIPSITSKLM